MQLYRNSENADIFISFRDLLMGNFSIYRKGLCPSWRKENDDDDEDDDDDDDRNS